MKILVTGAAGFIGFHVVQKLLARGDEVIGLDSINDYYDINLKYARLTETGIVREEISPGILVKSLKNDRYQFIQLYLEDSEQLMNLFKDQSFDAVCHLAAQAGVRYSLENPGAYIDSNIRGFLSILEACRHHRTGHLVFAGSSSVYGLNEQMPFSTRDNVDHPVSLYAASKKSNELMAHTYSHLFGLPCTGLRFFTAYGPWGRPDMALFLFTKAIMAGEPLKVFNHGNMQRDFTYVDDIAEGILRVLDSPPVGNPNWDGQHPDPSSSRAPYKIYNIGNQSPVQLLDFIKAIEQALGKKALLEFLPLQPGDVPATYADISDLTEQFGYRPSTPLSYGIAQFVRWYLHYYQT